MNTVLITGSEGNIGTYLVGHLKKTHPETKIIRVNIKAIEQNSVDSDCVYIGDLGDASFVEKIFQENTIDYVIHAAARQYSSDGFKDDAYGVLSSDIACLLNVINNCSRIKKFVYLSSAIVYENSKTAPFTEEMTESIYPPKSSYGLAKFFGEKAVAFLHQQYGTPYTIWRPFNVVSPMESYKKEGAHVHVDFYRKLFIEKTPSMQIYGTGQQVRCFTWVEDLAEGVIDFLTDVRTNNQIFNIGGSQQKTLIELLETLVKIGKEKNLLAPNYNPGVIFGDTFFGVEVKMHVPSTEKIKKVLGWESKTDFNTCFERFIEQKQKNEDQTVSTLRF